MYSSAENAYAALDFSGLGHITEESFLKSHVVSRLKFTHDQIKDYFSSQNMFAGDSAGLNFDSFKKNFFPHLYAVNEDKDDEDDIHAANIRHEINHHKQE